MANPTLVFSAGGSDTGTSGDNTAVNVSGTAAATHANTTVNITDAVNLGGVPLDGSACLRVSPSSGRQWSKITNITGSSGAWVVTVADAYANTESGRTWAIGGQRVSFDNATQLGLDVRGGWSIDNQSDQTLTANFRITPNVVAGLPFTLFSSVGSLSTKIQTATNNIFGLDLQGANNTTIKNLYFKSTAGTPGYGLGCASFSAGAVGVLVQSCIFDGWKSAIETQDAGNNVRIFGMTLEACEIKNSTSHGIIADIGPCPGIFDCYIHDNGTTSGNCGLQLNGNIPANTMILVSRSVFANNFGGGIVQGAFSNTGQAINIEHCDFWKNGQGLRSADGIQIGGALTAPLFIKNNIFWGNGSGGAFTGYGINVTSSSLVNSLLLLNNAFGGDGTAPTNTITTGTNPVTLTVDPFVSSTNFNLNGLSGGGLACKGMGAQPIPNAYS